MVVLQATVRDREGHTVMELGQRGLQVMAGKRIIREANCERHYYCL